MQGEFEFEEDRAERFDKFTRQYLKDAFATGFDDEPFSMDLIGDASGKFFTDVWQPIRAIPYEYEYWTKQDREFKLLSVATIIFNLVILGLILLFRYIVPVCLFTLLTIGSIVLLGYTVYKLVKIETLSINIFR